MRLDRFDVFRYEEGDVCDFRHPFTAEWLASEVLHDENEYNTDENADKVYVKTHSYYNRTVIHWARRETLRYAGRSTKDREFTWP